MTSRVKPSKSSRSSPKQKRRAGLPSTGRSVRQVAPFDYRLEHHPEFLRRVAAAREAVKAGAGIRLEDLPS
jgi:hypothetical protein